MYQSRTQLRVFESNVPRSRSTGRIPQENTGNRRNMEAVFRWTDPVTGFIRFRPEQAGSWQNRQPDSWHFPAGSDRKRCVSCGFQPENSRNTASGIIDLGIKSLNKYLPNLAGDAGNEIYQINFLYMTEYIPKMIYRYAILSMLLFFLTVLYVFFKL